MRAELKAEVAKLKEQDIVPGLAVVLVGEDPASKSYVTAKERACEEMGIYSDDNRLPADTSQEDLMALVEKLNNDPKVNGILVQLPLPKGLNEAEVLLAIDPAKDVDGFHPMNVGKMVVGEKAFLPCTPHGVLQLLMRSGVAIEGAEAVIVGRSNIVGKPLANMLIQKSPTGNATVTVCHTRTKDLAYHTKRADIVIAAAGRPNTVTADMVKDGFPGYQREGLAHYPRSRRGRPDDDNHAAFQHGRVGQESRRHRGLREPATEKEETSPDTWMGGVSLL
jgi:methylenetetrahydrofolate dehydrogenase (NADP+)/methenyltetrahydrofolate cyclohydrolase